MLGVLPPYICSLITWKSAGWHFLQSHIILLSVPNACTEQGKKAFVYFAPSAWNTLQNDLRLNEFISVNAFKSKIKINGGRLFKMSVIPGYKNGYFKLM